MHYQVCFICFIMHFQVCFIVINVCFLRWLHKDFQITKIRIITVHMIYWYDDVLSSYPNLYMHTFLYFSAPLLHPVIFHYFGYELRGS